MSRAVDLDTAVGPVHLVNRAKAQTAANDSDKDDDTAPVISLGAIKTGLAGMQRQEAAVHLDTGIKAGRMSVDFELLKDNMGDEGTLFGFGPMHIGTAAHMRPNGCALLRAFNGQGSMNGRQMSGPTPNQVHPGTRFRMLLDLFDGTVPGIMAVQKVGPATGEHPGGAPRSASSGGASGGESAADEAKIVLKRVPPGEYFPCVFAYAPDRVVRVVSVRVNDAHHRRLDSVGKSGIAGQYTDRAAGSIVVSADMVPPQPPTASDTRAPPQQICPAEGHGDDEMDEKLGASLPDHEVLSLGCRPLQAVWRRFMATVAPQDIGETAP